VLARVGVALELPKGRQLEISGNVGRRDADDGATILERAVQVSAVDLGGLGTARLLAIGGVVGGNLYCVLLSSAVEGTAGGRFLREPSNANALGTEEHVQQFFLLCTQILAKLFAAGVRIGPGLSIRALGNAFYGGSLASDVTLEVLPARLELGQCHGGAHLTRFRHRPYRGGLGLRHGCAQAERADQQQKATEHPFPDKPSLAKRQPTGIDAIMSLPRHATLRLRRPSPNPMP
jgi:hypothetical protein